MREVRLEGLLTEQAVRDLRVGDVVHYTGPVHTMRDMAHRRAVDMLERGEELPFDLHRGVLWHCAPVVSRAGEEWVVRSAGPTTSSRFTELGAALIRLLQIRMVVGKGTMGAPAARAMAEVGCCYLTMTGGCAALYADRVQRVEHLAWADLGLPEAVWVLRVTDLGPLVVGIDSTGASLYEQMGARLAGTLPEIYARSSVDPERSYAYLPRRIAAAPAVWRPESRSYTLERRDGSGPG
ncbi:MAG: FumA C-terminus/TtdB family hydratase beta subunit [Bacillota bacterium]|nr:FumA C-terminus/TtdB family hydratase beta subunit [Bacillota bacterium]